MFCLLWLSRGFLNGSALFWSSQNDQIACVTLWNGPKRFILWVGARRRRHYRCCEPDPHYLLPPPTLPRPPPPFSLPPPAWSPRLHSTPSKNVPFGTLCHVSGLRPLSLCLLIQLPLCLLLQLPLLFSLLRSRDQPQSGCLPAPSSMPSNKAALVQEHSSRTCPLILNPVKWLVKILWKLDTPCLTTVIPYTSLSWASVNSTTLSGKQIQHDRFKK